MFVFLDVTKGFEFVFVVFRRLESVAGERIDEFILKGDYFKFELIAAWGDI